MWKILVGQIREETYKSLIYHLLFLEDQNIHHREKRWSWDLLYVDQHILKECKAIGENVSLGRVNK